MAKKECYTCKKSKDLTKFGTVSKNKDKKDITCKDCCNKRAIGYRRTHSLNNQQGIINSNAKYRMRIKKEQLCIREMKLQAILTDYSDSIISLERAVKQIIKTI